MTDLLSYDHYIVAFSGGKDSTAVFLWLLENGVDRSKIELWHNEVDGREGSDLMDWECTVDYCRKFAAAFNVPIYFSWKEGGFEREFLRENSLTAPVHYETPTGVKVSGGIRGEPNTRWKFPQVGGSMATRWCSSYLKMDVSKAAIAGQPRFLNKKTLYLSGERGEESTQRQKYEQFFPHACSRNSSKMIRIVDHLRFVLKWTEKNVWAIIERWAIHVHPAYYLGYGRVSCKWCIFADADQVATSYHISPAQGDRVMNYEERSGWTIKRNKSMRQLLTEGKIYTSLDSEMVHLAISREYYGPIFISPWILPAGAYKRCSGPS